MDSFKRMNNFNLHKLLGVFGVFIFIFSLVIVFFTNYSYFYTFFLLGSWFILDYINFSLTKKSILNSLLIKKNRHFIFFILIINAISAFLVDYVYGVKIVGMWEWNNYGVFQWIIMLVFMTLLFCFVVYETYCFFYVFLSKEFREKLKVRIGKRFERIILYLGFIMLILPLLNYLFLKNFYPNYFLIFAFIGIWFITEGVTNYFGGKTLLIKILNGDKKVIFSIIFSTFFLAFVHEFINFFAKEWAYVNAPFHEISLYGVPISILLGWFPLVIFCISVVNLIKTVINKNK